MSFIESIAQKVEEYGTGGCIILGIGSAIYISKNQITDFTDKFTIFSGALLTFIAIFYAVIIVSEFITKLDALNEKEIDRLMAEITKLTGDENDNIQSDHYEENAKICDKKTNIYNKLANIKNRKINKFLFISAFSLILMLVIDSKFIPEIIFTISNYKPYVLLTLMWIALNYILKIVLLFYKTYSD